MGRSSQMPVEPLAEDYGRREAVIGMKRLALLASQGGLPRTLSSATMQTLSSWRTEPITRADFRERVELLQAGVDDGVVAAEDYVATAETAAELRQARFQLDALLAIRTVLAAELAELAVLL